MEKAARIVAYPSINSMIFKKLHECGLKKDHVEPTYKNVYFPNDSTDFQVKLLAPGGMISFWKAKTASELTDYLLEHKDKLPVETVPIEVFRENLSLDEKLEMANLYLGDQASFIWMMFLLVFMRYRFNKIKENSRLVHVGKKVGFLKKQL